MGRANRQLTLVSTFVFCLALSTGSLPAEIVEVDLEAPGDALITRDTVTGFDWLDIPLTTNVAYDEILGGAGGWVDDGWRHATRAEVEDLFQRYATPVVGDCYFFAQPPYLPNYLGPVPIPLTVVSVGYYDDGSAADGVGSASVSVQADFIVALCSSVTDNAAGSSESSPVDGNFLVRCSQAECNIGSCPLLGATADRGVFDPAAAADLVSSLYRIRDSLGQTAEGRRLVQLYYEHAGAAAQILVENPALRRQVASLLAEVAPVLRALGDDDAQGASRVVIRRKTLTNLERVIDAFEWAAPGTPLVRALRAEQKRLRPAELMVRSILDVWSDIVEPKNSVSTLDP